MTDQVDYLRGLDEHIEKLVLTVPTDISDTEVLELETFLNDLYQYHLKSGGPTDMNDAIISALSQASELAYRIKKEPDSVRDADFFSLLKKLPRLLRVIRLYMEDE